MNQQEQPADRPENRDEDHLGNQPAAAWEHRLRIENGGEPAKRLQRGLGQQPLTRVAVDEVPQFVPE
jgi:hypothetical protein